MPQPDFTLSVGGKLFGGWKAIKLTRSLERLAAQFEIEASNSPESTALFGTLQGGAACAVAIDGRVVLDGYIDAITGAYDERTTSVRITGRDRTGDLMDCAATVDGPHEYQGQTLAAIVAKIVAPFNIKLTVAADTGSPFALLAVQPGETAWEFIERACKYRAILPVSDGVGGLILTKPGTKKSAGRLVYGENILGASAQVDYRERFSLYVVKGQGKVLQLETPEESAQGEGRATDAEIARYRPTVINAESEGYDLNMTERAVWQLAFNRARSKKATYITQGWYAAAGEIWQPNTLLSVVDTRLGISGERLIASVCFDRSESRGTLTTLELMMPDAFNIPAEKQKDDVWDKI